MLMLVDDAVCEAIGASAVPLEIAMDMVDCIFSVEDISRMIVEDEWCSCAGLENSRRTDKGRQDLRSLAVRIEAGPALVR